MNAQSNWGISSDYTYDIIGEQVSFHDEWNRLTFGVDYSKGRDNVLRAAGFDVNGNPVKTNHWYENYSFIYRKIGISCPGGLFPEACGMTALRQINTLPIFPVIHPKAIV